MEYYSQISLFDGKNKFVLDKEIRLIEFFGGYGSQALGLKYADIPFKHHKLSEWAVKSIQAYKDLHFAEDNTDYSQGHEIEEIKEFLLGRISFDYSTPATEQQIKRLSENQARTIFNNMVATNNLGSITTIKGEQLKITETDKYIYMLTYSFPCFVADTLVLTRNGYKKIVDIKQNDYVLTHDNTYQKVVNTFDNGFKEVFKINGMAIDEIKATLNHKFYVRQMYREGHNQIRKFKEPQWKELKNINKKDYFGVAINQENRVLSHKTLPTQDANFWWLIGRYMGDGWIRSQGGIIICCAKNETYEIIDKLNALNFNFNIVEEKTVVKIHIARKKLGEFCEQFGKGAVNKHLTQDIIDLPKWYLESFVEGYLSADGCFDGKLYRATSVSRELIYGIGQCVAKVYKTPYRIYKVKTEKTKIIQGRVVNQRDWYSLSFKKSKDKQDKAFYENGYIWYPIKSIESCGFENVYDIEVENNHSFTAQNTIVHNCQDLSTAGQRKGFEKDSGTRSGLLWEVGRILKECEVKPQVLIMENVPDITNSKNIKLFTEWQNQLVDMGYKNKWEIINAKNQEIPQNRERCFMVSVLGDYYYDFPCHKPLKTTLNDYLEEEVDEKYYLSDKQLVYVFDCNRVCDNTKRGDLGDRIVNPQIAKTISVRGAVDQRADITNFVVGDNSVTYSIDEMRNVVNLKRQLCNTLIEKQLVSEGDVIRHSYSNNRLNNGEKNMSRIESNEKLCPTLDTRCDCLGIVVRSKNQHLRKLIGEIESCETQALDTYNQTTHNGFVQTIRANIDKRNEDFLFKDLRIRKFTPRECFRLMGVKDEDFDKIAKNQSNASLYHLAGDSIVVNVLMAIYRSML